MVCIFIFYLFDTDVAQYAAEIVLPDDFDNGIIGDSMAIIDQFIMQINDNLTESNISVEILNSE